MNEQPGFIVIAEFPIKPGEVDAFVALAHEDAHQSLTHEPGCLQFDVLLAEDNAQCVVLHEAYADRAAFDAHTQMSHYEPFKTGSAPLLAAQPTVRFFHIAR